MEATYNDTTYILAPAKNICQGCEFLEEIEIVKDKRVGVHCLCPVDFPLNCGMINIIVKK